MNIPAAKICFNEEDKTEILAKIKDSLSTGSLTLGKYGKEFEEKWASYIGTKYAVSLNSGTASIELPLRAFDIKGKDVLLPTNTFIATANAVVHAGGKPVLVDAKDNLCMDPKDLQNKITKNTKGVIFVHIGGFVPKEVLEVQKICKDNKLFLIEDAAHAHGATLNGVKAGTFSDAASFSFYPTKIITSGEGGMINTNSEHINNLARVIRDQGKAGFFTADFVEFGHNYRMSELKAAVGLTHFKHLDAFIKERNEIAKKYNAGLKKINGIKPLAIPESSVSNYYKYVAFLDEGIDRANLKKTLKEKHGVGLSGEVYEKPLHLQGAFKSFNYKEGDFPVAEKVCSRHVCLPIYQGMTDEEINHVINSIAEVLK